MMCGVIGNHRIEHFIISVEVLILIEFLVSGSDVGKSSKRKGHRRIRSDSKYYGLIMIPRSVHSPERMKNR